MYKLTSSPKSVICLADGACISLPPAEGEGYKYADWLNAGGVPLPADPVPVPSGASQIEAIERQAMLPRAAREFMLGVMEREAIAAGAARTPPLTAAQSIAVLRAGNAGYRKVKELDEQIVALRP